MNQIPCKVKEQHLRMLEQQVILAQQLCRVQIIMYMKGLLSCSCCRNHQQMVTQD
jgi:hypothetical protein